MMGNTTPMIKCINWLKLSMQNCRIGLTISIYDFGFTLIFHFITISLNCFNFDKD